MRDLTPSQLGTLTFFHRHREKGVESAWLGVSAATDLPVIAFQDRQRFVVMAVSDDGSGFEFHGEVRALTEDEMIDMPTRDNITILQFPTTIEGGQR